MNQAAPQNMPSSAKLIQLMGTVSLVCGLLIVSTHQATLAPIRANQETIMRQTVAELLPGANKQITYGVDGSGNLTVLQGVDAPGPKLFAGYDASGKLIGVVLEGADRGYADVIRAMYSYSLEKQAIIGFKVTELKETPGLGDKIVTDPKFLANFKELDASLKNRIVTVKSGTKKNKWEIDAISGATISSRAVGRLIDKSAKEMIPIIQRNRQRIEGGN
ncbi:MAG: FMN-binding protein [Bryobacterales bacterium]|nr:FMN-binding protein [Bryobacterales bacterium]